MKVKAASLVTEFLSGKGFRVLVVGGMAMQLQHVAVTQDVDLLLTVRDFSRLDEVLRGDPLVTDLKVSKMMAVGGLRTSSGIVRFDMLDPRAYSGTKSGDTFFDFVDGRWSEVTSIGRVVRPAVVWYMRMLVPGELYLDRIMRDIEEGAKVEWLDQALEIATHFGTSKLVKEKLRRLAELGALLGSPTGRVERS